MTKEEIRGKMKQFLAGLSDQDRHGRSLAACQKLIATREFKHAQLVMIFLSLTREVETSTLAIKAWQEGKNIAVPRVDWSSNRMEPVEIQSLDLGVKLTGKGMREPIDGKAVPLGLIDMVVIPGMAFDESGFRVGRGRGFYDRFLSQLEFSGQRCALCFDEQLQAERLPCEAHDIPMDLIVTDKRVIHCHSDTGAGRSDKKHEPRG